MTIRKVLRRRLILLMLAHLLSIVPIGLRVYALGEPKWAIFIFGVPFFSIMIAMHVFVVCPNCGQFDPVGWVSGERAGPSYHLAREMP
jgi:hypothetical protein